jgi:hypothetical protein
MSQNDPMFLFGLTLAVVIDLLLVWIVFGMTGALIAALAVHLLVGRVEARRARVVPAAPAATEREAR